MQQVYFGNGRGQRLAGVLAGEHETAAVICCHGMLATKEGLKHRELAESLAKRGVTTLRFDFAGRGDSDGDVFDLTYTHEIEDLRAAIAYLAGRGVKQLVLAALRRVDARHAVADVDTFSRSSPYLFACLAIKRHHEALAWLDTRLQLIGLLRVVQNDQIFVDDGRRAESVLADPTT